MLIWVCPASAQKRIRSVVNPNAAALNASADIYDPSAESIAPASGAMLTTREDHSAVAISGGKVLIAGGYNNRDLKVAEIYDPVAGTTVSTENEMNLARSGSASVLLKSGRVLILGGYGGNDGSYMNTAEVYEPWSGRFDLATMNAARRHPTATLLKSNKVLVAGGYNGSFLSTAEVYDPGTSTFSYADYMNASREGHAAVLLSNGKVLITGGCSSANDTLPICSNYLSSAELYDPETNEFTNTGAMATARAGHTATLLPDGRVLIVGGRNASSALSSAEIFDPSTGSFSAAANLSVARFNHTATLANGKVVIAGGYSTEPLRSAEIFEGGTFRLLSTLLSAPRSQHVATTLADGRLLFTGGRNADLLAIDINYRTSGDNVSPNIVFSSDSSVGFVPYTGSGLILKFSTADGSEIKRIATGGKPAYMTPLPDGQTIAVVSALDNRIFLVGMNTYEVTPLVFANATFGFGSLLTLSPDGTTGYISSTSSGEVIKFRLSDGVELGRLSGLRSPAQITITGNGATLFITDTIDNVVVVADSASMKSKFRVNPMTDYPSTSFTIYNKAVLNQNETYGLIATEYGTSTGCAMIFNASTGEIVYALTIGASPSYTALLPDGSAWIVRSSDKVSTISTTFELDDDDFEARNVSTGTGAPLSSANLVVSADSKYAYYTSSTSDVFVEYDIVHGAEIGSVLAGDQPDKADDQSAGIAFTPDLSVVAVLNLMSAEVDLLTDSPILKQSKLVSERDRFTGLSIINTSSSPVNVKVAAVNDVGTLITSDETENPVSFSLAANAQRSVDASALFLFDADSNVGRILVEADRPAIVAFTAVGRVRSSFPNSYTGSMQGVPFAGSHRDLMHNYIIPEIPTTTTPEAELSFVNPNYNTTTYDWVHYSPDGVVVESKSDVELTKSTRQTKTVSSLLSLNTTSTALIVGGLSDSSVTDETAEYVELGKDSFTSTEGVLHTARYGETATLLGNQNVLIAGGRRGDQILRTAEVYDPTQKGFHPNPGAMRSERHRHTATLLTNGKVLLAGGQDSTAVSATAELYDPETNSFAQAGAMTSPRDAHTASRLSNGGVLLAGGIDGTSIARTAEVYDPSSNGFTRTGDLAVARAFHTAATLPDGKVLIAGGYNGSYLNSAEIYDPSTGQFSAAPSMNVARSGHTCTLLSDGTIVIIGGMNSTGPLHTTEVYDPATGIFVMGAEMESTRVWHTATLLADNEDHDKDRVIVVGGYGDDTDDDDDDDDDDDGDKILDTAEIYNPRTQDFVAASGTLHTPRQKHATVAIYGGAQGYVRVSAQGGHLFSETYSNGGGETSINGINLDKFSGITKVYSPKFAIRGDAYETRVNIINANQTQPANITLILHAPDGTVLGSYGPTHVPVNGQIKGNLWTLLGGNSALLNSTGWLEVASSVEYVVGTVSFTDSEDNFLTAAQLSGTPLSNFVFPLISSDASYSTDISLLNAGSAGATVQLQLWDLNGNMVATRSLTLGANQAITDSVNSLFSLGAATYTTANVRVSSNQPLHAFGTLSERSTPSKFISSIPATPTPGN